MQERSRSIEINGRPGFICSVRVGGYFVNVFSDFREFLPHFSDNETPYVKDIPGWRIGEFIVGNSPSIVYLPQEESEFDYNEETKTLTVKGKSRDFSDGQALAYISFWLTERERQEKYLFTLHAAGLSVDGKGILLIGDRGSGKTSIALGLAERYKCELVSNDLSIIRFDKANHRIILEEGSNTVRLRLSSVKQRFPQLLHFFSSEKGIPPWLNKKVVDPRQIGLETSSQSWILSAAFTTHLDSNISEPLIQKRISGIEIQFELYENLSRIIRGSAINIFGAEGNIIGYLPSLENKDTHKAKVDLIDFLVKRYGVFHISGGNMDEVCKAIYDSLQAN